MNKQATGSKPKPGETRKTVDLDDKVIQKLQIQAINTGNRNFKQYAELVLIAQSNKDTAQILKELGS